MIVDPDLPDHPKTWKLSRRLGLSREAAIVLLLRIWGHCQVRRSDLLGADAEDVAACARWEGSARSLLAGLLATRWIDETAEGYTAHGWRERNASWLSRIEGGKKRQNGAARDLAGRMVSSLPLATSLASEPASLQLAGARAGRVEWSGVEKSGEENPHQPRSGVQGEGMNFEALISAKKRMCLLLQLDPARAWTPDAERALQSILPIPEAEWLAVEWLHRCVHKDRPKLRMSPGSLTAHWSDEVSKARQFARDLDTPLDTGEKNAAPITDPEGWSEWLAEHSYPDIAFSAADASLRREFREKKAGAAA